MEELSPDLLSRIIAPYSLTLSDLEFIARSQNHVYRVNRGPEPTILRISLNRCRTAPEMEAELRWIDFLAGQPGLHVCRAIPSENGKLVEELFDNQGSILVSRFEHAPGRPIAAEDLTPSLFTLQGEMLGRLHQASMAYCDFLGGADSGRKAWNQSRLLNEDMVKYLPPGTGTFQETVRALIDRLRRNPLTHNNYGMIHGDVYFQNYHLEDDQLWLFDFDNAELGYYIRELAVTLYDCVFNKLTRPQRTTDLPGFATQIWEGIVAGFNRTSHLDASWLPQLRDYVILREAEIYIHYHRIYDVPNMPLDFQKGVDEMRQNVEAYRSAISWVNKL